MSEYQPRLEYPGEETGDSMSREELLCYVRARKNDMRWVCDAPGVSAPEPVPVVPFRGTKPFWFGLGLVTGTLLGMAVASTSAHAEDCNIPGSEPTTYCLQTKLARTEKALAECRNPPALDRDHLLAQCMVKQGRFNMAHATIDARLASMWQCAIDQGIRYHNDP